MVKLKGIEVGRLYCANIPNVAGQPDLNLVSVSGRQVSKETPIYSCDDRFLVVESI